MAKKRESTSFLSEVVATFANNVLFEFFQNIIESIKDSAYAFGDKVLQTALHYALFFASLIFICVSAVLLISDYLAINKGWIILIIGLLLLFWSFMLKLKINKR